jgi:anaerobic magnesium-protoporphyrin IX monomethyl ester cyclase
MRIVLADIKGTDGFVHKDTIVGGYGARLRAFSTVTRLACFLKKSLNDVPSVTMAYLAAILHEAGHEVRFTRGEILDGDVALVLSSLVDHRNETRWADAARAHGLTVGFVGLAASKLPQLFSEHADFIIKGEPEEAVMRLARGERLLGVCASQEQPDLSALPFPRWDLLGVTGDRRAFRGAFTRPIGGFPVMASRSCPEFCTYCPHRILAGYRARSVANIADELERLCDLRPRPYVIFRDPLFSEQRDRCLELCDEIRARGLTLTFEAETRLDRLDADLIDTLYAAGLRAMSFGVESTDPLTLKKSGRRPIPPAHQRRIIDHCRRRGIVTAAFYVLGFLQDNWESVAATIDYATDLGSTFAQFKILTPYPGTPMFRQLEPLLTETDWEKFDGYTPTFTHPHLTKRELQFLLGAAYTRFYMRPSYLANFLQIQNTSVRDWVSRLDRRVNDRHTREEIADIARPVAC